MGGLEITSIHEMGFMLKDKCGFLFDLLSPGGAAVQSKRQGDRGGDQQRMRGVTAILVEEYNKKMHHYWVLPL